MYHERGRNYYYYTAVTTILFDVREIRKHNIKVHWLNVFILLKKKNSYTKV